MYTFETDKYNNGRIFVRVFRNGEPCGVISTNIPEFNIADDEIIIKSFCGSRNWIYDFLKEHESRFVYTGRHVDAQWAVYPIYRFVEEG